MLRIVVDVNRPPGQAIGIKEQIALDLEKYGDTRVVSVEEIGLPRGDQMQLPLERNGQYGKQ